MRTIAELLRRHAGAEAWIFGKGPSLDQFDMAQAGSLRICINESLLVVPDASYFFAHDEVPIQRVAANWPPGCRAILQPQRAEFAQAKGIPEESILTYCKSEPEPAILSWTPDRIAQRATLLGFTGTVHSALHFCRLIGAVSVVFVGFDGAGGYANCIKVPSPLGGGQHDRIRRDSLWIADQLGLSYRFA